MTDRKKTDIRNAILIGVMCSISYLAVYFARNTLSAVSPSMIEGGNFTEKNIGTLSSIYFITYAVGQLINGALGDKIKSKYMISVGLVLAGVSNIVFSLADGSLITSYIAYAACGFFLSMIYGPMTKVVAENTEPIYTVRCSLGYTFASFFGSPLAGVTAALLAWQGVFAVSSASLLIMGTLCFVVFTVFEKTGVVKYGLYKRNKEKGSVRVLFERQIVKFTFIAVITGVVRTTVVFWLPTYLYQYLGFSTERSALIFTIATFIISLTSFIAVFVYEVLGRNMDLTVLLAFTLSTLSFVAVYFCNDRIYNIIFLIIAIMASCVSANMLYSRYCPSLRDTGMVSSATGFLDFMSYAAASASSTIFANATDHIGWKGLIGVWVLLTLAGVITALPYNKILKK